MQVSNSLCDTNLNHTGAYLYSKGKIMIHLVLDYADDKGLAPGEYLRYHRTFQGISTKALAEKAGIVPGTLTLYEKGKHPIKHSAAVALAQELGIDRQRLLDEYTSFVDFPCGELLQQARNKLSLSQAQIAAEIGVAQNSYSGWERGARTPRRKEYKNIVSAFKKRKVDIHHLANAVVPIQPHTIG
ncbi:helix-turn-helix domain-containing protein [Ruminococcaceae bacterium OttesenSCG-928-D13]|nr:helix-turn-helix domain-containing protein [Ruminococcaceae bacterium OttesenSCG-928-D13]